MRRLGVPASEADDVTQQVFLTASKKLADIVPEAERSFLFNTAIYTASNARRSHARRREVGIEPEQGAELFDPSPLPDELADRQKALAMADEILASMPLELRAVLILFEVEEMSTPEIASMLSIPVGTAASRLRRAREDVQERLKRVRARSERPRTER
ncbi:MAG: hypothetical protein NVSMB1_26200 [Polyangiales bacterium]